MADATRSNVNYDAVTNTQTATVTIPYKGSDISLTVPIPPQARSLADILRETEAALRGLGQDLTNATRSFPDSANETVASSAN
jgi:hypothetical protein